VCVLNHIPIVIIVKELIRIHGAEQLVHLVRGVRGALLGQYRSQWATESKETHLPFMPKEKGRW
jgi:hypothetical protein